MDHAALELELAWFAAVMDLRFGQVFGRDADAAPGPQTLDELPPPALGPGPWGALVSAHAADLAARLGLVLALVPHLRPQLLDPFFIKNATFDRRFTEFGGVRADDEFLPTGETLAFLLDGGGLAGRAAALALLDPEHPLHERDVLRPAPLHPQQPALKAPLRISAELLSLLLCGRASAPALGADFPASRLHTNLEWSDLVLHPSTLRQIEEIQTWLTHGPTLLQDWGMAARLRPGYRALFYGPPGTGKTMSAALLGKLTGRDVYRVDLSLVVSKYIGETEKNLSRVFARAEQRGWILFFDEADALFGKRGETQNAHDRYANQEVAYLLQRIEGFDGVVILASNLRDNIDDAFLRRFESVVYFPPPRAAERAQLWRRGFSPRARIEADLDALSREHELTGGAILNVVRQVSLSAIADGARVIGHEELVRAIKRERSKEGRGP